MILFINYAEYYKKSLSRPISRVLSRTVIHLDTCRHASQAAYPGALWVTGGTFAPTPLFGLAPNGVCPATLVAKSAVRSYRTISPLLAEASGIFSVALSVGSHHPDVIWRSTLWSPDFPPLIYINSYCLADSYEVRYRESKNKQSRIVQTCCKSTN